MTTCNTILFHLPVGFLRPNSSETFSSVFAMVPIRCKVIPGKNLGPIISSCASQVELAEAQLNYIIGQTDTLLQALDQSEDGLDAHALLELSVPEEELQHMRDQYLLQYRASLQLSKQQLDARIHNLEQQKV